MKKTIIFWVIAAMGLALSVQPAAAGDKQRHRWEGVAIGVGAAILGHALMHSSDDPYCDNRVEVYHHYACAPTHHRSGYWESRRVWVAPECEKVWNPGHYTPHGRWVSGRWRMIETSPGYWREDRVWVGCR